MLTRCHRLLAGISVHVCVAGHETEPPIQAVGRLSRRARSEINGRGSLTLGLGEGGTVEGFPHSCTARISIDNDIFDPGAQRGRNTKQSECQGASDLSVDAGDEQ